MTSSSRSLARSRVHVLALLCGFLAAPGCLGGPRLKGDRDRIAPNVLRSLETQGSPDGSSTQVILRGDLPLSYSISSVADQSWSLTLEGVDPRRIDREVMVGTPQLNRILVRRVPGETGRPGTQVDFEGVTARDRRVRLEGNDLMVELAGTPGLPGSSGEEVSRKGSETTAGTAVARRTANPVPHEPTPGYRLATRFSPSGSPSPEPAAPSPLDLVVGSGKSMTLGLDSPVSRVSMANPAVADAVVISPQELLINGLVPGNTSLVLWFKSGPSRNYNLTVQMDTRALEGRLHEFFPREKIDVAASKETLVLSGTVSKPEIGDRAAKIASDYSGKVVNNLTYPATGRRQILLKVVFAEVNREAITELSASFVRVDPHNLRGDHEGLGTTGKPAAGGKFLKLDEGGPDFTFNDAINIYAFNFRDKIAGFISALKTRGLLQVLAEPTLITADGQKASFLAGGEFPIPVAQAGAGFTSVTIVFKKFGISLDFTPDIRADGTIVLKIEPEVSSLDFANAVVLSGFTIPSLKVRRASTEVELKDGQSFAIAGLYSADLQQTKRKIPVLGDVPLLGYLFRSKSLNKNKTELLVIATPILVEPLDPGQKPALPQFDQSFDLEKKQAPEKPSSPRPSEPKRD